jgi:hypothetical protein
MVEHAGISSFCFFLLFLAPCFSLQGEDYEVFDKWLGTAQ